jgi:hypothetical protein
LHNKPEVNSDVGEEDTYAKSIEGEEEDAERRK